MDLAPAQREAWAAALPQEDQRLLPLLRDVLAQEVNNAADFLTSMPSLGEEKSADVAAAGDVVGPYKLIREIGRGGMGTVWLADRADGSFKRLVALKLPRLAWGSGLVERMAREREIGALLEHPSIARLYDAGMDERGRPYLALEYIEGVAIDVWCEQRGLRIRERLQLVVQVARAVSYAHARLVVHRDLKPANVLITNDGVAHLLDFGIAKLINDASPENGELTRAQGRVLTPHFASPEQLRGDSITVQSDIYSLGVMAYHLLTGNTPYKLARKTMAALEEAILEGEPLLASERVENGVLAKSLRGEVDSILSKALKREPALRYTTADAFADDVERYLAGERVHAQPDTSLYRLRKALRRHWLGYSASAAVVSAIVIGSVAVAIQAQRAAQAADRERIVKQFVTDVFRINTKRDARNGELGAITPESLVEGGAKLIETRFKGQPELQSELYGVVGAVFLDMGAYKLASDYFYRQEQVQLATARTSLERSTTRLRLVDALTSQGRPGAALRKLDSSPAIWPNAELSLEAQVLRAKILLGLRRYEESKQVLADFFKQRVNKQGPDSLHARAIALSAALESARNALFDSPSAYRAAIAEALAADGPGSPTAIDIRLLLAKALIVRQEFATAKLAVEAALTELRASGQSGELRAAVEEAYVTYTLNQFDGISFAEASQIFERLLATLSKARPSVPRHIVANVEHQYAGARLIWGDIQGSDKTLVQTAAILSEDVEGTQNEFTLVANLGHAAMYSGRHEQADSFLRRRLALQDFFKTAGSGAVVISYIYIAINLHMSGRSDDALAILNSAPKLQPYEAASTPSDEIDVTKSRILAETGHVAEALALLPSPIGDTVGDNSVYLFGLSERMQVRGEVLCAAGETNLGLATGARQGSCRFSYAAIC